MGTNFKNKNLLLLLFGGVLLAGGVFWYLISNSNKNKTQIPSESEVSQTQESSEAEGNLSNEYRKSVIEISQAHENALLEINKLSQDPATLANSVQDQQQVYDQINIINENFSQLEKLEPTTELSEFHQLWVKGMQIQVSAMGDLDTGLKNKDADLIKSAADKLRQGATEIDQAMQLLEK